MPVAIITLSNGPSLEQKAAASDIDVSFSKSMKKFLLFSTSFSGFDLDKE